MKKLSRKKRLNLYFQASLDFKYPYTLHDGLINYVGRGFCFYFQNKYNLYVWDDMPFKKLLPELYAQKPENMFSKGYWFIPGDVEPRHAALIKAHDLCKQNSFWNKIKRYFHIIK